MTDRNDPDRHDAAESVPPDHDLPTAGRKPPHQPMPPDEDPTVITPPGMSGGRPAAPFGRVPDEEPTVITPPAGPEAGPPGARPGGSSGGVPGGWPGGPGAETRPISLSGTPREVGEETKPIAVPATAHGAGPEGAPGMSRDVGRDAGVEPEPGGSAERVNRPGGVDAPVAVGDGDDRVRDDGLAETAGLAAAAVAERPGGTAEEAEAERGGSSAETGDGGGEAGDTEVDGKGAPRWRLSSAGALIWVLLALFGFTLVVQLRSNTDDQGLATARQEDLVRILSDLEARDSRLQTEIAGLESSQQQLTSGVSSRQAALAEAAKRADELGLLAGTLPGKGPGLRIVIDKVKASAILNAVEELRGAGGEVMELAGANGVTVRIVASSYFVDAEGGGLVADGARVTGPYTLWVIGSPQTMQTALQIPGGVVESVNGAGGSVTMEAQTMVQVAAVRKATTLQYAHPVS